LQLSHVDPAIIGVWRWHGAFTVLTFTVLATVFSLLVPALWLFPPVLVAIAGLTFVWLWPPLAYRHLRFGVDETGIAIESGVIWRSRVSLPRVRIQHTDVSQGPLERRYGIGTLKLYTAGSRHVKIELQGLNHDEALALRDALLAEGGGSGV
jgi:membrane protein YdbS with pleckstrin-like domain